MLTTPESIEQGIGPMRLLHRTLSELKVLSRKVAISGDEAFKEKVLDNSYNYIRRKAPLWLNSDDQKKKELAMLVCKGTKLTLEKTVRR